MPTRKEMCEQLLSLFAGRSDVFAVGKPHRTKPGKLEWFPRREPLTAERLGEHLSGAIRLGVYPLVDSQVHWFAVDIDGAKDIEVEDAWEQSFAFASVQATAFAQKGLLTYIERSQSGRGAHLWGFLSRPLIGAEVRRAINPMILPEVNKDLVYPVQDVPDDLGNLLALPWYGAAAKDGRTVFVDRDGTSVKLADWLEQVRVNDADLFTTLVPEAPTSSSGSLVVTGIQRPEHKLLPGFLKLISPYGCRFMRHCAVNAATIQEPQWRAALSQCSALVQGRDAAHVLSEPHPHYSTEETDYKFDRVSQRPVYTCQYIRERWPEVACKDCGCHRPVDKVQQPLLDIVSSVVEPMARPHWGAAMQRVLDRDNGMLPTGVLWGLPGLDQRTRLRRSEQVVLGAPSSIGKTAFMVDRALALARVGTPVMVFSCETGETALLDRMLANETGINSRRLRGEIGPRLSAAELERVQQAAVYLASLPLFVSFASLSPDQVYAQGENVFLTNRLKLRSHVIAIYDYLQLSTTGMRVGGQVSPYELTSMLSAGFKALAKVTEWTTVLLSQLIRSVDGQEAEDASINQFRESGRIENDTDEAFILGGVRDDAPENARWLANVKGREGDSNYITRMRFYKPTSRFEGPDMAPVPDGIGLEDLPVSGVEGDRAF